MMILLIFSVLAIPFRVGFDISPNVREEVIDDLISILFAIDILVHMNSMYFDNMKDCWISDRSLIIQHYLSFWFWIDLASTLPFDSLADWFSTNGTGQLSVIRLIRILRLIRIAKLYHLLKETTENHLLDKLHVDPTLLSVITLFCQIFFIAHLFACFWHFIAISESGEVSTSGVTWITEFGYTDSTKAAQYVASLYFVIVTMLTIGYGDIYPTNDVERIYAIIMMIVGGVIFGALVAQVATAIDKRNPQQKSFNKKMYEFKVFLANVSGLSLQLRDSAKVSLTQHYSIVIPFIHF